MHASVHPAACAVTDERQAAGRQTRRRRPSPHPGSLVHGSPCARVMAGRAEQAGPARRTRAASTARSSAACSARHERPLQAAGRWTLPAQAHSGRGTAHAGARSRQTCEEQVPWGKAVCAALRCASAVHSVLMWQRRPFVTACVHTRCSVVHLSKRYNVCAALISPAESASNSMHLVALKRVCHILSKSVSSDHTTEPNLI